jgi:hypothetical protein
MAKDAKDSIESIDATTSDVAPEASPYLTDEAKTGGRFSWIKSKPAKIAAVSVGGALALGAVFAGGVAAGQISSHDNQSSFGEKFDGDRPDGDGFGKHGQFSPDGDRDGDFENHPPRPPHRPEGNFPGDLPSPDGSTSGVTPNPSTQSN